MTCYHLPWTTHTIGLRQPWQCYNHPWAAHTIGRRRALNVIIALGQYTWQNYVSCDKLSSPLKSIHDGTMSGGTGYHRPWKSQTIIRCQAWHARITIGRHTWLDDVRRGMPSLTLYNIHGGVRSCVLCHHRHWKAQAVK